MERDPTINPQPGDVVKSCYDSIGERHVVHVSDCGVTYRRVRPNGARADGYCLPSIWTKWCRAHRVKVTTTV
ncbi:MAG: hypothetical protein KGL39_53900 [Patescibacteria group bacterium]|nr:hypothetical protein [Patescibacteria group bacterium]